MSYDDATTEPGPEEARAAAARHKRRARVFGDVLPEATSDERADTWGDQDGDSEEWLRRQVPPHHG
jgi:hypothetical protein